MIKMEKIIDGELRKNDFPERNLVRLKSRGWKVVKPQKKNKGRKP
jgi:hypothetical protein